MQLRIKNLNRGGRGAWIGGDLVEIDGNSTGTFTGANADERDAIAAIDGLKVQSRLSDNADWTDHFKEEMPEERPWLAVATDPNGGNFKALTDFEGVWYVGTAVAGERPDTAAGYVWSKIGGGVETDKPAKEDTAPANPVVSDDSVPEKTPENEAAFLKTFAAELVAGNASDVIAAVNADNASDIKEAEEKREGGPRKGVMKAVEEAMATEGDK